MRNHDNSDLAKANEIESCARLKIQFVNGSWRTESGREVTAVDGTRAELFLHEDSLKLLFPDLVQSVRQWAQFLGLGAKLRFALTVRNNSELSEIQKEHLISHHDLETQIDWSLVKGWHSQDAHFIEVTLDAPTDHQKKEFPSLDGGLLVYEKGGDLEKIESSQLSLPKGITDQNPFSLNNAYTVLSEIYEVHRASHTGSIYNRVFYQGDQGKWYPLAVLRDTGLKLRQGKSPGAEDTALAFWESLGWKAD